jgi:hypothetical protein
MSKPNQTLLEKRLGWFSNHPVFSVCILVALFVGGLGTFTESAGKIYGMFRSALKPMQMSSITCTLRVSNSGPTARTIVPFSEFSLVRSDLAMMRILAEGRVELVPKSKAPDQFTIPAGGSTDFEITMPRLTSYEAILEEGGANLYIPIHPTDTRKVALASAMFQRSALLRYHVLVDLADASPSQP